MCGGARVRRRRKYNRKPAGFCNRRTLGKEGALTLHALRASSRLRRRGYDYRMEHTKVTMKRVIIDTDPGIDDTAAIFLALASPELHVEALTTVYGNGTIADCTRNALVILETAGRSDIPVYQGVGKPLMGTPTYGSYVHGGDALGDVGVPPPVGAPQARHAVYELVERVMASPGEITLIALGPLTNVALALSLEPRLASALAELIVMGGAVLTPCNITAAETSKPSSC